MSTTMKINEYFDIQITKNDILNDGLEKTKQEIEIHLGILQNSYKPILTLGVLMRQFFTLQNNISATIQYIKDSINANVPNIILIAVQNTTIDKGNITIDFLIQTKYGTLQTSFTN